MNEIEQNPVRDRLIEFINLKKIKPKQFEQMTGLANGYIKNIRKSIKSSTFDDRIHPVFPELNKMWLIKGEGEMLNNESDNSSNTVISVQEKIKQLSLTKKKNNGEGTLINDSDLVESIEYRVPIKGQAGLKKAFFYPDEYIETHFVKETILVKPSERGVYHKIEVDGNSMKGILDPGDWARCEDIPKIFWMEENIFKKDKVYCLFHVKLGILFKRISKVQLGTITLTSENPDKEEYPDQTFELIEFSKILIVRKVEKEL